MAIDLSVVIPIRNESLNLAALYREFTETLEAWGRPYELLLVDDGAPTTASRRWRSSRRAIRGCA